MLIDHSAVQSVARRSRRQAIWRLMKKSTLLTNHSAVQSVARHSRRQAIWRPMKKSTLVTNHSAVQSGARHSRRQSEDPWKNPHRWQTIQLSKVWQDIVTWQAIWKTLKYMQKFWTINCTSKLAAPFGLLEYLRFQNTLPCRCKTGLFLNFVEPSSSFCCF